MQYTRVRRKALLLCVVICFIIYELFCLYVKYGQLFYTETFLPQPNLPVQLHENSGGNQSDKYKILCLITTSPKYHATRAVHVAATWARHCSRAVFVTSESDVNLPDSYVVSGAGGYYDLWKKVTKGFEWVYDENMLSSYDWVLKVDDDTFVFIENLAEALQAHDPNHLIAAGHKLYTWETHEIYLNGGAGYVLSSASVRHLVSKGLKNNDCETNLSLGVGEDVNMALCLRHLGISLLDFRDTAGNSQFHIYPPQQEIDPRQEYAWSHLWLKIISVYPYPFGLNTMTDKPISFHYVDTETMYLVYYLVYVINQNKGSNKEISIQQHHQPQRQIQQT